MRYVGNCQDLGPGACLGSFRPAPGRRGTTTAAALLVSSSTWPTSTWRPLALAPPWCTSSRLVFSSRQRAAVLLRCRPTLIARPTGPSVREHRGSARPTQRHPDPAAVWDHDPAHRILPGYVLGVWAPIALIALRFVNGISLGGEYTGGDPACARITSPKK
ncbi:MHS family MFS transporter [Pseudonocardia sp. MCCB 268]|nr:MHS family MFS transporter [Pseudonocardia cytotoxica]